MGILSFLRSDSDNTSAVERERDSLKSELRTRTDELDAANSTIAELLEQAAERAAWNKEITDRLGKADLEIEALKSSADLDNETILGLRSTIASLTPDATAWRARQQKAADYEKNRRKRPARGKQGAR